MIDFSKNILSTVNLFDIFVIIILVYNVIQCFLKGFSLSLISFMKWVLSTIITIILVPKLQPIVSEYIQSDFINNVGLGIFIFVLTLFVIILIGKTLSKAVTWTGVGSIDKSFGFIFGFFKGYVVSVCLFRIQLYVILSCVSVHTFICYFRTHSMTMFYKISYKSHIFVKNDHFDF